MRTSREAERLHLVKEAYAAVLRTQTHRQGLGAPLRDAFFRHHAQPGSPVEHPLARLMSARSGQSGGGRGGRTRVLLYISLLWVASGHDHSTSRPARFWAELLGLDDPSGAGARAIRSTWRELEARGFVQIEPPSRSDLAPSVSPLREDGSGSVYAIPTGEDGDTYRRVPQAAWRRLFWEDITGPGLAMYLIAIRTAEQARTLENLVFPRTYIREEYGLGDSTIRAGLQNLTILGVLDRELELADSYGGRAQRSRRRYVYDLLDIFGPDPSRLERTTPE